MKQRNLDGYYFRVKRGDKYQAVCFTDLTFDETKAMLEDRSDEWLGSLLDGLVGVLTTIVETANDTRLTLTTQNIIDGLVGLSLVDQILRIQRTIVNIADYYDIVVEHDIN